MATTTRNVNKFFRKRQLTTTAGMMCALLTSSVFAQQRPVSFGAGVRTEVIQQSVQSDVVNQGSLTTFSINPQLTANYQSRRIGASFVTNLTHLERENEIGSQEQTFTQYSYQANAALIENVLSVSASGALNFRNAQAGNFLINDFVNDQGQLRETRTNTLASQLSLQNGDWLRTFASVSYGELSSEENELLNIPRQETNSLTSQVQISQGDEVRGLVFNVSGQFSDVDQNSQLRQGDFDTRFIQASIDLPVFGNWGIRVNGQHEGNDITNLLTEFTSARSFNTVGAGITYLRTSNRTVSVTYNVTESDIAEQDGIEFVGLNLNWAFSGRTSIVANYTRRFFGESGNVAFRYNTRKFRSSINYVEQVTNNTLLLAANQIQNQGVFVCPIGEQDINACFLPPSIDFQPTPDQQFVQFGDQNLEINDNVILRKSGVATFGYSFTKLSASLVVNYADATFLDTDANRRTVGASINLNYNLGAFTNLSSSISYADIVATTTEDNIPIGGFQAGDSENINFRFGLNRRFGRSLRFSANYSYIEGMGDRAIGFFGSNFRDRRITLGVNYTYR